MLRQLLKLEPKDGLHHFVSKKAPKREEESSFSEDYSADAFTEDELYELYDYSKEIEKKFQALRLKDFLRLDDQKCIYLDYTGSGLAPRTLVEEHARFLIENVLGNPHSGSSPSRFSTELDTKARNKVLEFVKADPEEYTVIWTPNASGALKLVGECYPFTPRSAYLYAPDCHNSVLGITEYAKAKKAQTGGFGFLGTTMCYDWSNFVKRMDQLGKKNPRNNLLAFPSESNASGLKHNARRYVDYAHAKGWDVCVDAAAHAPTNAIDLTEMGKPEFVSMSFYKIFGYPTGIGCLVVKRSALRRLQKPWFAGGTVGLVGAGRKNVVPFLLEADNHAKFEDGTINFQNVGAVLAGIVYMQTIGMDDLSRHVTFLSAIFENCIRQLTWDNGAPLVYIPAVISDEEKRGHALSMVFLDRKGKGLPSSVIDDILSAQGIAIRTGCFCNPGSGYQMLNGLIDLPGKNNETFVNSYLPKLKRFHSEEDPFGLSQFLQKQGMVRVSFGPATNRTDIDTLVSCIEREILSNPDDVTVRVRKFYREQTHTKQYT
jgi:molybdenum cofactor sulfurtransferase